jgi:hypothetical protein
MTVYFAVPSVPEKVEATDMVMYKPTFLEEIAKTRVRRGVNKLTTASSLRDIFMAITDKYDQTINPYHLKLNKYEGIAYDIDEDLVAVVYRVIKDNGLNLVESALDKQIKARPHTVERIYYVTPDMEGVAAFTKNGISAGNLDQKGKKPKNSETVV